MISLIASDMDGTLLNDKMQVSDGNINAIKAAQDAGIEFIVATGRSRNEALPLMAEGGIKPALITMNGAQVFDQLSNEVINIPIEPATVVAVTDELRVSGYYFELMTTAGNYSDSQVNRIQNVADLLVDLNPDTSYKIAVALAAARLELMNINYVDDHYAGIIADPTIKIVKIIAFSTKGLADLEPVKVFCEERGDLIVTSSSSNNIEINHINAQKGIALAAYAKEKGIPMSETMAIGDNLNDYSMIEAAGIGVAMANAVPTITDLANYHTAKNTQDGVAQAIYHAIDLNQAAEKK
ncbi:HAD family phosphatase [Latilactobacillus sakei]|uniref:Cof-type HAD-IIB family hydrolase n=1 Tax=Latilactobacillus sakei TaxID=1599 RepID=UPI000DCAC0FB|nr:Cof-type HAD-IIB family hydrolase [Latilactobacillus sakei]AWZ44554.1 Cof-type HAD-IIB family hydrolase [Latilactobacillus sakei]QMU87301.1 HAD family phosphatase [Latilactobacillus sakei]UNC19208.1 HAD family phosphatase [Latilactobacillus sakei]